MTHKTKGIVLRTVKYGETSLIVTILTASFGVQSYIVNGVRTSGKKGSAAIMYQPAAILQLEVYHKADRNLHRIKEASWSYLYNDVFSSVPKHSSALYMMEVLYKLLKQPEGDLALFDFCQESLIDLDTTDSKALGSFSLYVTVQLPKFFGFNISVANLSGADKGIYFDMETGDFGLNEPTHNSYLQQTDAIWLKKLAQADCLTSAASLNISRVERATLLDKMQTYYSLHLSDYGILRTLPILKDIFL